MERESVQKQRSLCGRRQSTLRVLAEQSIADFANEHVAEITEREWDDPQHGGQESPGAAHCPENPADSGAADPCVVVREQHNGGELLAAIHREQVAGSLTLQR